MKKRATKYGIISATLLILFTFAWVPFIIDVALAEEFTYIEAGQGVLVGLLFGFMWLATTRVGKKANYKDEQERYGKAILKKIDEHFSPFIGTEVQFKNLMLKEDPKGPEEDEIIVGAANRLKNGIIFATRAPYGGHGHSYFMMEREGVPEEVRANCDEGFITSHGRFVDRFEGWKIAENAGQIFRITGAAGELYSEDMWDPDYFA